MASLGRLSAGIVHEINSPIGSIFSNNEVIIRSLDKLKRACGRPREQRATAAEGASISGYDLSLAAVDQDRLRADLGRHPEPENVRAGE